MRTIIITIALFMITAFAMYKLHKYLTSEESEFTKWK